MGGGWVSERASEGVNEAYGTSSPALASLGAPFA